MEVRTAVKRGMTGTISTTTVAGERVDAFVPLPLPPRPPLVSSQIESRQSSLSDLLLFEADEMPGVPLDDVQEVSSYVAALDHGLSRLRAGFPLSSRLLR